MVKGKGGARQGRPSEGKGSGAAGRGGERQQQSAETFTAAGESIPEAAAGASTAGSSSTNSDKQAQQGSTKSNEAAQHTKKRNKADPGGGPIAIRIKTPIRGAKLPLSSPQVVPDAHHGLKQKNRLRSASGTLMPTGNEY